MNNNHYNHYNDNKNHKKPGQDKKSFEPSFDITCPYNFVPLNEKVIFPEWANDIYHDIPFSDGLSGEIKYSITAKSPILISSGKGKENKNNKKEELQNTNHKEDAVNRSGDKPVDVPVLNLFCKDPDGNYFIPGTSLKGAFRSLLEILSFSKLSIYDDYHYSYRDLCNKKYKGQLQANNIRCGWLSMESETKWKIEDCGLPGRISHAEIDKKFRTDFVKKFSSDSNSKILENEKKHAKYKYETFFENIGKTFNLDSLKYHFNESQDNEPYRKLYNIVNQGNNGREGTIVFTGQPSVRNENSTVKKTGKWLEFIFFDPKGQTYTVDENKIKNFKLAYFNNEPNQSEDWEYWKLKQNGDKNFKIPVFFVPDKRDKNNDDKILHFGLSQLYKLPYKFKISDLIKGDHLDKNKLDFAQCLFGFISNSDDKNDEVGLKGRIQFGHAFVAESSKTVNAVSDIINKILSSPKATFYPFYLNNNAQELLTYDDQRAKLAGFKRYPVHLNANIESIEQYVENKKLLSRMRPLPEGTVFEGRVSFHNLKPEELGALLSALTFNDEEECFHTLGGGKPFGFGKSKVHIESLNIVDYDELKFESAEYKTYIFKFNEYVKSQINKSLNETTQYKELIAMAKEYSDVDVNMDKFLNYMKLEDFAKIRKSKCYLKPYSKLVDDFKNKIPYKCFQK